MRELNDTEKIEKIYFTGPFCFWHASQILNCALYNVLEQHCILSWRHVCNKVTSHTIYTYVFNFTRHNCKLIRAQPFIALHKQISLC